MNWFSVLLVIALASIALSETLPEEYTEWEGRVVGGSNALSGQFPYQASFRSASNSHFCGGSIINNRYALTAAHCTYGRTIANTRIVVGTHLLNTGGVTHSTIRIVNHPGYNANSLTNDLSIVQTQTNIIYNNFVQPIALGSVFIGGGVGAIATGWGLTTNPGSIPNNLQFVSVQTLANGDCRSRHSSANAARVYDNTLCSFSRVGQGTCMGDSGGPLASGGTVIGLVSWGIACALGVPDVYARVSAHRNWIMTNAN